MTTAHNLLTSFFKTITFLRVLRLAKIMDRSFVPLGNNKVIGTLLEIIYDKVQGRDKTSLMSEASVFGLAYIGDTATVKHMPLINVLV